MEQYISYHFFGKYRWKFDLSVQQLSKADQQSISEKRWIFIRFQKVICAQKTPLAICHCEEAPYNKHRTSCICFRICAWCFMFHKK